MYAYIVYNPFFQGQDIPPAEVANVLFDKVRNLLYFKLVLDFDDSLSHVEVKTIYVC